VGHRSPLLRRDPPPHFFPSSQSRTLARSRALLRTLCAALTPGPRGVVTLVSGAAVIVTLKADYRIIKSAGVYSMVRPQSAPRARHLSPWCMRGGAFGRR